MRICNQIKTEHDISMKPMNNGQVWTKKIEDKIKYAN